MSDYLVSACFSGHSSSLMFKTDSLEEYEVNVAMPRLLPVVCVGLPGKITTKADRKKKLRIKSLSFSGMTLDYMLPVTCFFTTEPIPSLVSKEDLRSSYNFPSYGFAGESSRKFFFCLSSWESAQITEYRRQKNVRAIDFYFPGDLLSLDCDIGYITKETTFPINLVCVFHKVTANDEVGITCVLERLPVT